jgi:hypothetical protein
VYVVVGGGGGGIVIVIVVVVFGFLYVSQALSHYAFLMATDLDDGWLN